MSRRVAPARAGPSRAQSGFAALRPCRCNAFVLLSTVARDDNDLLPIPATPALVAVGRATVVAVLIAAAGCSDSEGSDAGPVGVFDAGISVADAGPVGVFDAGIFDAGIGPTDAGVDADLASDAAP